MLRKIRKILTVLRRKFILQEMYINSSMYMKHYVKFLRGRGMQFEGVPNYISNDVHFDGKDYSIIKIGNNVTISREVLFLTHDYSMHTLLKGYDAEIFPLKNLELIKTQDRKDKLLILSGISVGNNSFIGARATLLPGTTIGNNCLIGSCSVVKGKIPDNSIVIGNPAKIVAKSNEWMDEKIL